MNIDAATTRESANFPRRNCRERDDIRIDDRSPSGSGELAAKAIRPPDEDVSVNHDHFNASHSTSSIGETMSPRIVIDP